MPTLTKLTAAILATGLIASPALAGPSTIESSVDVNISGYDLSLAADAQTVLNKIESAAEKVCDVSRGVRLLEKKRNQEACVEKAVSDAMTSLALKANGNLHASLLRHTS